MVSLRAMVGVVVLVSVLSVGGATFANHQFSDVPSSHPFHGDIDWLASTGITTGFADGTFRAGQPVTRQAMAAFLRRYAAGTETVWTATAIPAAGGSARAYCPDGKVAVGGGYDLFNLFEDPIPISSSYPSLDNGNFPGAGENATAWTVRGEAPGMAIRIAVVCQWGVD